MFRTALLLFAASLVVALARPRLKPLSSDMVNYINKVNTTWKVISIQIQYIHQKCTIFIVTSSCLRHLCAFTLQAGHNFHNVDYSYIKQLCGTILKGPKLPVM